MSAPVGRPSRHGALLVVVAGIAAMFAGLTFTYLLRMRSDVEESRILLREAQARVMLNAALAYIQESSRIGWGREAFGWCDVRDGQPGPRDASGMPLVSAASGFPRLGGVARCPMHVMQSSAVAQVDLRRLPRRLRRQ